MCIRHLRIKIFIIRDNRLLKGRLKIATFVYKVINYTLDTKHAHNQNINGCRRQFGGKEFGQFKVGNENDLDLIRFHLSVLILG